VTQVRALISDMRDTSWTVGCAKAAEALDALGSALRATSEPDEKVKQAANDVLAQGHALRCACQGSFEVSDRIKDGLSAALQGLESATADSQTSRLDFWVHAATQAVDELDPNTGWVFQRARVQDAFRTVSDAFAVASQAALRTAAEP
jgi:hypothetical protein